MDANTLENTLKSQQWVGGQAPTNEDKDAYEAVKSSDIKPETHPNLFAWFCLVSKFSDAVRNSWTGAAAGGKGGKGGAKGGKKEEKKEKADDDFDDLFGDDGDEDPEAAKKMLALYNVNKVMLIDKNGNVTQPNANLFSRKFNLNLNKLQ